MNNQKTWIVVTGLAIVIGGVAFLGGDFPTDSDQASGTIVPAERYRGEQISSKGRKCCAIDADRSLPAYGK